MIIKKLLALKKAIVKDRDNNEIYLENFEYQINETYLNRLVS